MEARKLGAKGLVTPLCVRLYYKLFHLGCVTHRLREHPESKKRIKIGYQYKRQAHTRKQEPNNEIRLYGTHILMPVEAGCLE